MPNRTYYALLGLVSLGPQTGYSIKRHFEDKMRHFWSESSGQVYPNLRKLNQEGLVKASIKSTGKRKRIEYSITKKGRRSLSQWLVSPSQMQPVRNELLLKTFLATQASLHALIDELERHQTVYANVLRDYPSYQLEIDRSAPDELRKELWKVCLKLGEDVLKARESWCEESARVLRDFVKAKGTK